MGSTADLITAGSNIIPLSKRLEYTHYSDINAYSVNSNLLVGYDFKSSNSLLLDNGPYAKSLVNYGGIYAMNSNMNSLLLGSSNYATFAEDNWLLNSNISISGWFKSSGFQDGDEILDFTYQNIEHPNVSPYTPAIQVNKNEYYVAFTNVGTNTIFFPKNTKCDILVVGGGGGGGGDMGGGGGAGGVVFQKGVSVSRGTYTITVGAGGAARAASAANTNNSVNGNDGTASSIAITGGSVLTLNGITYQANGGGGGANYNVNTSTNGNTGGSGGGGTNKNDDSITSGGATTQTNTLYNTDTVTNIAGGYPGSDGQRGNGWMAGGGGGAGGTSGSAHGGSGVQIDITGQNAWYAAGGGGGVIGDSSTSSIGATTGGKGGSGIGGNGNFIRFTDNLTNYYLQDSKHDGTNGTGAGGGGGARNYGPTLMLNNGGAGGSGIVIIRYTVDTNYDASFFNNTTNLEAWYKFDGGNTNMLLDSSGKGRNLTNNGATFDSNNCRTGSGSLALTAKTNFVQIDGVILNPYSIWLNNGITFAFWFKASSCDEWCRLFHIVNGATGTNPTYEITCGLINGYNDGFYVAISHTGSISNTAAYYYGISGRNTFVDNNWHHVVWSINYNATDSLCTYTVYIDGINKNVSGKYSQISSSVSWTRFGISKTYTESANGIVGNIDDFRIYNKVLSADEVNILYNIGYNIVLKRLNNNLSFELNNTSVYNVPHVDNAWNQFIWNIENVGSQGFVKLNNGSKNYYNKVLQQSQLIRNYPVASLGSATGTGTDANIVLSAQTHGNGLYRITASSSIGAMASYGAHLAFNKASPSGEAFWGSAATYSASTTFYTGTVSTIYNNNLTYLGEWLQIQLPQNIVLTSYTLVGQVNTSITGVAGRSPKNFIILGSSNGINWTLVDTEMNITGWANLGAVTTFTTNNVNQAYSYYRICINANQGDATYGSSVSIAEWELFGYIPNTYVYNNMMGSAVNKGSLYLADIKVLTNTYSDAIIENASYGIAPNSYHVNYQFKNQASLLTDDGVYNRTLTNSGGVYALNDSRNSIYLTANTEAFIPNQNWSLNVDLTLSCWFKTNLFENGDKLIDFNNSYSHNIVVKNNNNKLTFQVNDISVYDVPFVQNRWYYLAWNICNTSSSSGYVQLNDKKVVTNKAIFTTTLIRYPRQALTTNPLTYTDGSGLTVVSRASSVATSQTSSSVAFNRNYSDYGWVSYGYTNGISTATTIFFNSDSAFHGHYLMIDLAEQIILASYKIVASSDVGYQSGHPSTFRIYATNDSNSWNNTKTGNWVMLSEQIEATYTAATNPFINVNLPNNFTKYRYYAIITYKTNTTNTNYVRINELELYAYPSNSYAYSPYLYTNKLGSSTNKGNVYMSDFKVLTTPITTAVQNSLYSSEIVLKNKNMTNNIQYYANSKINSYLHYKFQSPALLTMDSSLNNRVLNNNGGVYALDSDKNSILLETGDDASFANANWSTFTDLSISGWFKTSGLADDDKLLEFQYSEIQHPFTMPAGITPVQIGTTNEYYVAFTSGSHTLTFTRSIACDILIVGGGGGGGNYGGGGGGGDVILKSAIGLNTGTYTITVGSGGTGGVGNWNRGNNGSNSSITSASNPSFISLYAAGGGGGASYNQNANTTPTAGTAIDANYSSGGGGGGASGGGVAGGNGGTGNGVSGNGGSSSVGYYNSGGGGAVGDGGTSTTTQVGNGGSGFSSTVSGSTVTYGGGGGGGHWKPSDTTNYGVGLDGGGNGGANNFIAPTAGANNRGGGGGGGGAGVAAYANGGNGGSGIVIIRYSLVQNISIKKINTDLSFQINNTPIYSTPSFTNSTWTHILWNIVNSSANGFVRLSTSSLGTENTYAKVIPTSGSYTNKLGSITNVSSINISDFRIITEHLTPEIKNRLYSSELVDTGYIDNVANNMTIHQNRIQYYNASSKINSYLHYAFQSPALLTIDSSLNNRLLNNNGGIYNVDYGKNNLLLKTGYDATLPTANWSTFTDLSISGWFKTSALTNSKVQHPFTSLPNVAPVAIGGTADEYYIAFTTGSYTVTFRQASACDILVVGGGGGGSGRLGGGGGGGAVLHIPNAILPTGTYNISIGNGGISYSAGGSENGGNTTITGNNISIIAQGGGGTFGGHDTANGKVGGSGGGAAAPNSALNQGGTKGTGSSLGGFSGTIYGNRGGNIITARVGNPTAGTGGGGAGSAAVDINPSTATGHGGAGILINITGNNYYWGGGGGGAGYSAVGGNGGIGGGGGGAGTGISVTAFSLGGSSALNSGNNGQAVVAEGGDAIGGKGGDNTGGGGGGGGWGAGIGGSGGSGIVIIRYNALIDGDKLLEFSYNEEPNFVNDTTNLMAWYKFENNWDTSATSIATYNLTNSSVSLNSTFKTRDTYSAYFDNTNNFLSNSAINLNNTDYSIAFWVRLTGLTNNSTQMFIVTQGNTNAIRNLLHIGWVSNTWYFALWADDCVSSTMDYTTVNNTWVHLVFTFDYISGGNNVFKIFMNGTLIGSKNTTSGNTNFATGTWRIGKPASTYGGFTGYLDDFRIYNRVLTENEIMQIYTYQKHPLTTSPSIAPVQIGTTNNYYVAFTSGSYTVTFTKDTVCDLLVIGGGGSGGNQTAGGAGACIVSLGYTLTAGTYNVTVGSGGVAPNTSTSQNGGDSSIGSIFIAKGGGGGSIAGGCSGGIGVYNTTTALSPVTTNVVNGITTGPVVSTTYGVYGNAGGYKNGNWNGSDYSGVNGGSGGGIGTAGGVSTNSAVGAAGNGLYQIVINGVTYNLKQHFSPNNAFGVADPSNPNNFYIGGGGSGTGYIASGSTTLPGGLGGGGVGYRQAPTIVGGNATTNTGSGGGGAMNTTGGNGGSGIVIIRYSLVQNIVIKKVSNNLSFQINNTPMYSTPSFANNTWTHILWNIANSSANAFVRLSTSSLGSEYTYTKVIPTSATYTNRLGSIANIGSVNISDFRIITEPLTTEIKNRLYSSEPEFGSFVDTGFVDNVVKNMDSLYYNSTKEVEANANGITVYGNLTATNDIVPSYSDMRLKQVVSYIDNPLDKIMQIQTFKYLPSELARTLNINDNKVRIGLSAQDVQKVLPEIVCLAPFDTSNLESGDIVSVSSSNYLSVSYERVVPLLVECLKELKRELTLYKQ
jgi:hypothetical protein